MNPTDVVNQALTEAGSRVLINSLSDTSPAAVAANILYTPKLQALSRSAPWDSFRAQIALTQLKAAIINGAPSSNPPPQPFQVEYAWPPDCLKFRFVRPTLKTSANNPPLTTAPQVVLPYAASPTSIPFVVGTDYDASGNPIKVILTNLYQAQGIYVRDLTQFPDLWDPLFLSAATALLAAYLINALMRNTEQMTQQMQIAKGALDSARAANANESITSIDHVPDFMRVRMQSAVGWAFNTNGPNGVFPTSGGWDSCGMPDGTFY